MVDRLLINRVRKTFPKTTRVNKRKIFKSTISMEDLNRMVIKAEYNISIDRKNQYLKKLSAKKIASIFLN